MKLSIQPDGTCRVDSDSGAVYTISYAGCGDDQGNGVCCWKCDCPAARYGRDCKHVVAFLASALPDTLVDDYGPTEIVV